MTIPTNGEIPAALRHWLNVSPDREAVIFGALRLTWREFQARIDGNAAGQLRSGMTTGDRIAVLDRNHPAVIETVAACATIGTTAVLPNINWTATQIASVIEDSGAKVVLLGEEFADTLGPLLEALPTQRSLITLSPNASADHLDSYAAWAIGKPAAVADFDPEHCVVQAYSSGTSGQPKGVMIPHRALAAVCQSSGTAITPHYDASSVTLVAVPMFHVAGLSAALLGLVHGGAVVIRRGAVAQDILDVMVAENVTHTSLVPAVYHAMLQHPDVAQRDWTKLRMLGYGAAPMPPTLLQQCMAIWPQVGFNGGYGLTETAASVTILDSAAHRERADDSSPLPAGKAIGDVEISIRNPDTGTALPTGEVGEIWLRTGQLMLGYFNDDEATRRSIDTEGWLHTGDIGRLDSAENLHIVDRLKDIIISGGENIASVGVEEVLLAHPIVSEAAVIGVADQKWGETVKAILVLADAENFDEAALAEYCRDRLARFARPTSFEIVQQLPRTASGKVVKGLLRDQYR